MRRYKKEVLKRLEGIESTLKLAVKLLEEKAKGTTPADERAAMEADKWLQEGIDQIMAFQPGKVRPKEG